MYHDFQLHRRTIDMPGGIHDLAAGCDPDFDTALDDLDRELAGLRSRFYERE